MKRGLLAVVLTLALAGSAAADETKGKAASFGLRAGLGLDPDQFVIGAQTILGKFGKIARSAPSFDLGFGNDVTTYAANADLFFPLVSPPSSNAVIYLSAGPTLTHWSFNGFSDTEIGFTIAPGLRFPMGTKNVYNLETRIGIGDIPDLRILFGVLFGGR